MVEIKVKLSKKEIEKLKKQGYDKDDIADIKDEIGIYGREQINEYLPYKKNMFSGVAADSFALDTWKRVKRRGK